MCLFSEELERYRSRKSIICSLRDIDFCTVVRCFYVAKTSFGHRMGHGYVAMCTSRVKLI